MLEVTPNYQYITPDELKTRIEAKEDMLLLSVQTRESYKEDGHLAGSIETKAYPANTEDLRKRLDKVTDKLTENENFFVRVFDLEFFCGFDGTLDPVTKSRKFSKFNFFRQF